MKERVKGKEIHHPHRHHHLHHHHHLVVMSVTTQISPSMTVPNVTYLMKILAMSVIAMTSNGKIAYISIATRLFVTATIQMPHLIFVWLARMLDIATHVSTLPSNSLIAPLIVTVIFAIASIPLHMKLAAPAKLILTPVVIAILAQLLMLQLQYQIVLSFNVPHALLKVVHTKTN